MLENQISVTLEWHANNFQYDDIWWSCLAISKFSLGCRITGWKKRDLILGSPFTPSQSFWVFWQGGIYRTIQRVLLLHMNSFHSQNNETNDNNEFLQEHGAAAADAVFCWSISTCHKHMPRPENLLQVSDRYFLSGRALLNDSRIADDFGNVREWIDVPLVNRQCNARICTCWREQRPSNKGDLESSITGEFRVSRSLLQGIRTTSDCIIVS